MEKKQRKKKKEEYKPKGFYKQLDNFFDSYSAGIKKLIKRLKKLT